MNQEARMQLDEVYRILLEALKCGIPIEALREEVESAARYQDRYMRMLWESANHQNHAERYLK